MIVTVTQPFRVVEWVGAVEVDMILSIYSVKPSAVRVAEEYSKNFLGVGAANPKEALHMAQTCATIWKLLWRKLLKDAKKKFAIVGQLNVSDVAAMALNPALKK